MREFRVSGRQRAERLRAGTCRSNNRKPEQPVRAKRNQPDAPSPRCGYAVRNRKPEEPVQAGRESEQPAAFRSEVVNGPKLPTDRNRHPLARSVHPSWNGEFGRLILDALTPATPMGAFWPPDGKNAPFARMQEGAKSPSGALSPRDGDSALGGHNAYRGDNAPGLDQVPRSSSFVGPSVSSRTALLSRMCLRQKASARSASPASM